MSYLALGDHDTDTFFEGDYIESLPDQVNQAKMIRDYPDAVQTIRNREFQMISHLQQGVQTPLISRATVDAPQSGTPLTVEGWRTVGSHHGAAIQVYESHLGRPQYRSVVAGRPTPPRSEPAQVYRDAEEALQAPDVETMEETVQEIPVQPKPVNKAAVGAMAALAALML
jgi:hypothetical protein